jgi:macrolide phosphotransferase
MDKIQVIMIANKHGLNVNENTIDFNESGLDFQVVFASDEQGNDWVLRFPRRDDVLSETSSENKVLKVIRDHVTSIEVPDCSIYTKELIAYKKLAGTPAATIDKDIMNYIWILDKENIPQQFHETLAEALVELHQIPMSSAMDANISVQKPDELRMAWKKRMETVKLNFEVDQSLWNRWQNWLQEDDLWPSKTGFIHGDIHAGHIMIDKNSRVTGLIDWTEAKISDISQDFVSHYLVFGEDQLTSLIRFYQEKGGYVWPKMKRHIKELAAASPLQLAEFAIKSGLEEYNQMAEQALKHHAD